VIVEGFGEFNMAARVDGHLEAGDASETPGRIGDGLDQIGFALADRFELVLVREDVVLVFDGIVRGKQNGAAGEGVFDGVQRRFGFTFGTRGAGRELGVRTVRGELLISHIGLRKKIGLAGGIAPWRA
jgi:hypothetical protein